MSTIPTLNGLRAITIRLLIPYRGVWVADVELDPDLVATAPSSGPALLLLSTGETLKGTIDPRGSSSFVGKASARVVGGGNGWDKVLPPQHFHSPAGVLSTLVYSATATAALEVVADPTPVTFAADYVRTGGPASRVFLDRQWFVDPITGITTVAPWPPNVLDPGDTILDWDPIQQRAEVTGDDLILPGTVLIDPRFNGVTYNVTDVEQTFDAAGSRCFVWCSTAAAPRLYSALGAAMRELARTTGLSTYTYRFALTEGSTSMALQAITPGAPDLNPIDQWTGVAGITATIDPSTSLEVIVGFTADTPPAPYVVAYSPKALPLKLALDASVEVDVGPSASLVALAGGTQPIALAPALVSFFSALQTWSVAVSGALMSAGFPIASAQAALVSAIGTATANTPALKAKAA
jgi:hypothetical protein